MEQLVKKIVEHNEWLNGMADFREGDLMAPLNQSEKFETEPTEYTSLAKLFNDLKNYEGVFKFENLLFFNSLQYGCFVYDINKPPDSYIEHFTIDAMTFESFEKAVNSLIS
ncbi:MAG: hypothetical protein DRP02_11910 [Candidatus Gerdarchaeota archaeon]|nr:MAG: hypothetical protein DRP02_11910 [Candidatus Gerdarchaeota archaeon]